MADPKSVTTPTEMGAFAMLRNCEKAGKQDELDMADRPYRELVGALLYIANRTRFDIAVAVGLVARRLASLRLSDWVAAKRILRNLSGTRDCMLVYDRTGEIVIQGHAVADCAMTATRKSISGVYVTLGKNAIVSWKRSQH